VPESSLRAFAGEQFSIISSDRRSFAHLAGRFPEPPAGDFFLSLAAREGEFLSCLRGFAAAVAWARRSSGHGRGGAEVYAARKTSPGGDRQVSVASQYLFDTVAVLYILAARMRGRALGPD
jgi:hypothetical protein